MRRGARGKDQWGNWARGSAAGVWWRGFSRRFSGEERGDSVGARTCCHPAHDGEWEGGWNWGEETQIRLHSWWAAGGGGLHPGPRPPPLLGFLFLTCLLMLRPVSPS